MKRIGTLAALLALGACAVKPDLAQIGPYPADYKELIKGHIDRSFFDPYSMRNVAISYPNQGHIFFKQGWIICLEANAKNRLGGYTGLKKQAYLVNNGQVINSVGGQGICDGVSLSPWPEMENRGGN